MIFGHCSAGRLSIPMSDEAVIARLRQRIHGALLGLALGDAAAAPTQWMRVGRFTPVRDLLGGGPFELPRGSGSDETAMMLATAQSLIACHGHDVDDQREALRRWQRFGEHSAAGECVGITASVAAALAQGKADTSQADGADVLVRLVPWVVYRYADQTAATMSRWDDELTALVAITAHEPATVRAARQFARMMHAALRGVPLEHIVALLDTPVGGVGTADRVLATATTAVASAAHWKEAVLEVVNLGGDSDIGAAVCGALAGAHWGVAGLPSTWLAALTQRETLESVADALLADVLIGLESEP